MTDLLLITLGVLLLASGAEALIRGALAAAKRLGVSPLLSGLIIVGFGTSMPELVVSVDAALRGQADIAIGNVVGSNIGNILLILGLCALITPLLVKPIALRRDAFIVIITSLLFTSLARGQTLHRIDALIFLGGLILYLLWAYRGERQHTSPAAGLHQAEANTLTALPSSTGWMIAAIILGLLLLISGSQVLLLGATGIAEQLGVSQAVIGLTLVAVGTSLPELSVSIMAALRRQADVAVGNILGSNIFNLLGILGLSALLQPLAVSGRILQFDQWVMLGTSLLLSAFLYTERRLNRLEGGILLVGYGVYVALSFTVYGG